MSSLRKPGSAKREKSRKRPTIYDVAKRAGVSIFTVSRAMNNSPGVKAEARARVLAAARALGMRSRPAPDRPHFALVIQSIDRVNPAGYTAMLAFQLLAELSEREMGITLVGDEQLAELPHHVFDGIFAVTWSEAAIEMLSSLASTPIVMINRFSLAERFHVVGWDHRAEGRTAARYLIDHGHRRLGMVAEPPSTRHSTQSRLAGFREACRAGRCPLDERNVELLEGREQLAAALGRLLDQRVDALYIPGQGRLGPEAVQILQGTLKVRVPEDISVLSGEHAGWSALFSPPLTTIDAPLGLLAKRSVEHMMKLIENKPTSPTEVLLDTPVITRKSVVERK